MKKKGTRVVAALAVVASLGLVVPASAAPAVKSKVRIKQITATGASGTVSSKQAKCEKRRKVALKFSGEYTSVRIGSAKTNKKGKWRITTPIDDAGIYFATTGPVKRGKVKCAGGESKTVRFG